MKKVILIVTDSLGVGEMPDAEKYGDKGCDTFGHIWEKCGGLKIPNLLSLGWGNIDGILGGKIAVDGPKGCFGRLAELSAGKDTTTGHWEIAGLKTEIPFKTYPAGFPPDFMAEFERQIGTGCLGNYPASGTEIIEKLGAQHEATGKPIVYTSADSVFQIAANTAVIPLERLYEICEIARKLLAGDWACGRVIARPYIINAEGKRERTSDRRDYSVSPPQDTILDAIKASGKMVYGVGKIGDIFNMKGLTESVHTTSNMDGVDKTIEAINMGFEGFVFTNLVDFDSKYGHRRDPEGYGKAIEEFDARLPEIMEAMDEEDVLMICADHGNDPTAPGTDHTREYIPLIVYGKECKKGVNLGTRSSFADIGATVCDILEVTHSSVGTGFADLIEK